MDFLWPRLSRAHALPLVEKVRAAHAESPAAVRALADFSHPAAAPIATGGRRVPSERIERVQSVLREIAATYRYPRPLSRSAVAEVDRAWSVPLYEEMAIIPADAASEGVWSFMSLVVAPDLAIWRFPDGSEERLLGRPRNAFRRLWARVDALGPDLMSLNTAGALGEDQLVQIMERGSLAASRRVVQELARQLMAVDTKARSELMRDLSKRIRRTTPVLTLDCLDEGQLSELIEVQLGLSLDHMTI